MSVRPAAGSYPLTLGASFAGQKQFHMLKYDFKPVSVDGGQVGELELRSDLSASLLLPQKPRADSSSGGDVSCVEFSGHVLRKAATDAPTCLLLFDPATREFTLERVDTSALLKQVVRDEAAGGSGRRKRKMSTAATMQRRAEVASKKPMLAAAAGDTATAATCAVAAAALPHAPASVPPSAPVAPAAPTSATPRRHLVHITDGASFFPEPERMELLAAHVDEEGESTAAVHTAPTVSDAPPARPPPVQPVGDFSFMATGALQAAAAAEAEAPPAALSAPLPSVSMPLCCTCKLPVEPDPRTSLQCDVCFEKFVHVACAQNRPEETADTWICNYCPK